MPLTTLDEPGEVDAFGVRFMMEDRGKLVRCHVFRSAINHVEESTARTDADLLARFQKGRGLYEQVAMRLYDAGHRTPWVEPFNLPG